MAPVPRRRAASRPPVASARSRRYGRRRLDPPRPDPFTRAAATEPEAQGGTGVRLASFLHAGRATFGAVHDDDTLVDLGAALAPQGIGTLRQYLAARAAGTLPAAADGPRLPAAEATWLPVIPDPGLILCVGLNYARHIDEMGNKRPDYPTLFSRTPRSQVGHGAPMVRPRVSQAFDYEGELAVVIGRPGRHIERAAAMAHVAGFSCYNDGSVRDWQRHTSQFLPGKNFAGTGPFGPWMAPAEAADTILGGRLTTRLNGEVMQDTPIDDLIFDIPALIAYISTFTDLEPGDVIVTGTPGGVGVARTPPVFLQPGDRVEVEITGIGTLSNPVVEEPAG